MKKALTSTISLALSLGMVAPAFAWMPSSGFIKPSIREKVQEIRSMKDVRNPTRRFIRDNRDRPVLEERKMRNRATSVTTGTKNTHLERTKRLYKGRRNRFRRPKIGSDRYRVLRPNTRYFRRRAEEQSSLPPSIVQTGGSSYDKPTRRDVRGDNGYFYRVNGRDRDVLAEIEESQ